MKVAFSDKFLLRVESLSGKILKSVLLSIKEVEAANSISEITNCKKLNGYKNIYRIRIGDYRAIFLFHIRIEKNTVFFEFLVPRGQVYDKNMKQKLRRIDKS
ncbi:MAG: hypothetical protein LBL97_00545 [Prevotellaceae bacterium]|nr:hypothetical protein [Prevotellaceae bacterium]